MNELSRHIEILLLDNDCVIVPGFGGFMAHHRPAEYIDSSGMFYPPQRTLGFNSQLKLNDSLLAQSYVEAYDISYPEAVRRIESEVTEIKQIIAINGSYEFHGIGIVTIDSYGVYNFEPCTAGLLTPDLYALNSFAMSPLCETPTISTTVDVNIRKKAIEPITEETEGKNLNTATAKEDNVKTIEIKLHTLSNILAAAMVLLLFIFSSIPVGTGSNKTITCSVLDTEFITSFLKDKTFNNNSFEETQVHDTTKQINSCIPTNLNKVETTDSAQGRYVIVLASKVTKKGAEKFISQLSEDGYDNARIEEKGSMRKVVYGNYATKTAANEALLKLKQSNERFSDGWICHK